MATKGKLEARITVPTGGYDATVGGVTKTIPAGTYYMSSPGSGARSFLAEVAFQFGASSVAASLGENGTGLCTIQFAGATAITWIDTELRDLLGFTGNLSAATSHISTQSVKAVWLPDVEWNALNAGGHWRGFPESDYRSSSNPAGYVWAVMGQERIALDDLAWHGLKQAKTWKANETTVNQSLERFWREGIWGTAAWATAGGPFRFHPDAAQDTEYGTYKPLDSTAFRAEQVVPNYVGIWRWQLPRLIQVPGTESQGTGGTGRAALSYLHRETASSTTDGTSFTTGSITPNPDRLQLLVVHSLHGTTAETPLSVVGCGLTWELVTGSETYVGTGTTRRMAVYRARGGAPSTGSLTISFTGTMTACLWSWVEAVNADPGGSNGSGAIVQVVTATAAAGSTTINATLAALENAANSTFVAVGLNTNASVTPDAQFTELGDVGVATPVGTLETEHALNQTTCDPTFAAAAAGIVAIEVKAAPA